MDPVYSANKFYDALVEIDGYEAMQITQVAQKVQRSAFPEAYAEHEHEGRVLASTLTGHSAGGIGCRLDDRDRQHSRGHPRQTPHRRARRARQGPGSGGPGDGPQSI